MTPDAPPLDTPAFRRTALRLGLSVIVLGGAYVVLSQAGLLSHIDRAALLALLAPLGALAPVAFVGLFALWVLLALPSSIMLLASAACFGPVVGFAVNVAGPLTGGVAAFWIARGVGRQGVEKRLGGRLGDLDRLLGIHGFSTMLLIRLASIFPWAPVSYAAGVSAIRGRDFVVASALGMLPSSALFTLLGVSLVTLDARRVTLALAGLAVLAAVAFALKRRLAVG